jgi:hypothetical protein
MAFWVEYKNIHLSNSKLIFGGQITENALIIWSPSPEDLITQCENFNDNMSLAKSEKATDCRSPQSVDHNVSDCSPVRVNDELP